MFRAKMTVQTVERTMFGERLKLSAQYSNSPEDNSYSKATPTADFSLAITNEALIGKINPGDQFYVDFSPIPK